MSFWLFKPSELASSKNLMPYKIENSEEFLNFLTLVGTIVLCYFYKKMDLNLWKKIMLVFFSTIILIGSLLHLNNDNVETIQGMKIPKYSNFSESLTIL